MSSESSRLINQLDPENGHQEIVSLLTNYEFPWDIEKALEFALFRTYAVPSIKLWARMRLSSSKLTAVATV